MRRAAGVVLAAAALLSVPVACSGPSSKSAAAAKTSPSKQRPAAPAAARRTSPFATGAWLPPASGPGLLAANSNPAALPGPILIADKRNNRLLIVDPQGRIRWQFPRPGDLGPGETFQIPDDAFFSPDGRKIIATEEDDYVISVIDIATHRITYRYGTPGQPGMQANQLDNPDDAMLTPNGRIMTADIKNCRLLLLAPPASVPLHVYGTTTNACVHNPPAHWGSPNGAFPMKNGDWLVTEINGSWVDEMTPAGNIVWSTQVPGFSYPSDSNEISPGRYLSVDYTDPGAVLIFDRSGHTVWRFAPTGADALNQPSLALPLPNGMVLLNDDANDRVIVVDPRTNQIVWQYGHKGVAGDAPGYLNTPDGVDLLAPYGLLMQHANTIHTP